MGVVVVVAGLNPSVSLARPASAPVSGGEFVPLQVRLYDATPAAAASVKVLATGTKGIPTGVSAVQVTVMALDWAKDGWIWAWSTDAGASPPTGSLVMASAPGEKISNTVIVAVGADGRFALEQSQPGRVVIDVQGYFTTAADGGGFRPVKPKRIVDTRADTHPTSQPGVKNASKTKLAASTEAKVQVEGNATVPPSATSVFVNVTLIDPAAEGYLYEWPTGSAAPPTSVAQPGSNFSAGLTVKLAPTGQFSLKVSVATHVVVDVLGYFEATTGEAGAFTPLTADVAYLPSLAPGAQAVIQVAGVGGIPSAFTPRSGGTSAVSVNLTTNSATTHAGYLDVGTYQLDTAPVWTTGLAFDADASDQRSNMVTVGVSASGAIRLKNTSNATVRVGVVVQGYYSSPASAPDLCGLAADRRLTSTYVTPSDLSELVSTNADTRTRAWSELVWTLHEQFCMVAVTVPSIEVNACTGTSPATCATTKRFYHSIQGRPFAPGGFEVDAVGSLLDAIDTLPESGRSTFAVSIGGRVDQTSSGGEASVAGLAVVPGATSPATWAAEQSAAYGALWRDVWASYPADHDRIVGWHITQEPDQIVTANLNPVDNQHTWNAGQREAFRRFLDQTTTAIHAVAPGTRTGFSPTYKTPDGKVTAAQALAAWPAFLGDLLSGDGVAVGRNVVDTVEIQDRVWDYQRDLPGVLVLDSTHAAMVPYFAAARQIVDARNAANQTTFAASSPARSQMLLVSDVELFDRRSDDSTAAVPLSFVVGAIAAEAPYVDGFTSYTAQANLSWSWFKADYLTWAAPNPQGWAYRSWLASAQDGAAPVLEGVRPDALSDRLADTAAGAKPVAVRQVGSDVLIDVYPTDGPSAADPFQGQVALRNEGASSISQVWLYRKINGGASTLLTVCVRGGRPYQLRDCTPDDRRTDNAGYTPEASPPVFDPWTFVDAQLPAGASVSYQAVAVNATGRVTGGTNAWTVPLVVKASARGATNLAAGRGYRTSTSSSTYPDSGHVEGGPGELTDGVGGNTVAASPVWQGFTYADTDVVIDLGAERTVASVELDVLHEPRGAIRAPDSVTASLAPGASGPIPAATAFLPFRVLDPATGSQREAVGLPPWGPATSADVATPATKVTYRIAGSGTGRYLKVHIPRAPWVFIAEIRAFPAA